MDRSYLFAPGHNEKLLSKVFDAGADAVMQNGPPLLFGTPDNAVAKWAAAARVLAEPSAAGATYLDLRVPGRVAAGGLEPVPQEGELQDPQP